MKSHGASAIVAAAAVLSLAAMPSRGAAQVRVSTSNGEVMTYTQKNLIDHLIIGDSIEVEMARLAASRTQHAAVRDFANELVSDHQAHLDQLRHLASKHDIGREANASDSSAAPFIRTLSDLKAMAADSGFDRAFVQAQIDHHQRAIDALKTMKAAATDDDVKKDIDKSMPVLENHLSRARAVAAQLGTPF